MRSAQTKIALDTGKIFMANDRMNQMILEDLAPAAWRLRPAGGVRTIAAIFTHIHNVRCKWGKAERARSPNASTTEPG